jgi:UDP-galactopyranose mutase
MPHSSDLVVFSHLRWNFVYQRPQHLLSRMARYRRVFFVEEPLFEEQSAAHLDTIEVSANVTVLRPRTAIATPGYSAAQMPDMCHLLKEFFEAHPIGDHVLWFYTPLALPLAELFSPRAVIYDCMDELSGFLNAPPEMLERESHLFAFADLVFTGGPSLYRAKKDRHPNVHCFPSSVDQDHFARGVVDQQEPKEQAELPAPRLGYCGVIDERINLELLAACATSHPEWQIVLVGPVVKIDPASLPKYPNIHYFGQKDYAVLPSYMRGWDVCLQPFARNAATRYISPTKTLEYMAAAKLIVSTSITDVAEPYGHIVYLGDTPAQFVAACEQALNADWGESVRRLNESARVLRQTSWDRTATQMNDLIEDVLEKRSVGMSAAHTPGPADDPVVVIGAGPTGLSAAYHLGERAMLVEQNETVGGWCRSIEDHGFTFDFAGHIMFSADPYVQQLYRLLLGENVHWQDREAWIYSKKVFTRYPFQGALYGLPPEVIKECLLGALEARFGPLKVAKAPSVTNRNGKHRNPVSETACSKDVSVTDCCADGILESSAPAGKLGQACPESAEPRNFEEFIYKVWGSGIARHFAIPYNRKLWAVPLTEMETSWLGGRVPLPDLEEMIDGALKPTPKPMGPNARFGYPLRGGFQALMNGFLPHLKGPLLLNTRVVSLSPSKRILTLSNGRVISYSHLVSTMPLPALISAMGSEAPRMIRQAVASLEHVSVRCVNLGVGRENLTDKHWIYYPEDEVFHRIFVQGNASPYCNPPGGFGLTCEITYSKHKPLPCDGDALIQRCIQDCRRVGIIGADDPIWTSNQVDMPYAYVVYNHARKEAVETIREWLGANGILLAGRYSEWEYYNSDHAFIAGKKAAEKIRELDEPGEALTPLLPGPQVFEAPRAKELKKGSLWTQTGLTYRN